jgi:hypothetical protein
VTRTARTTALALATLGLAATLTACADSQDTADANAAFCDANAGVQAEVEALRSLVSSGDVSLETFREQVDQITEASAAANNPAEELAESVRADLRAANEAFSDAVEAIPDDAGLAQAVAAYRAAVAEWESSIEAIRSEVGC